MLFYIYDLVLIQMMRVLSEQKTKITQQKCALSLNSIQYVLYWHDYCYNKYMHVYIIKQNRTNKFYEF